MLPISQRKDSFIYGFTNKTDFQMLWLRKRRKRANLYTRNRKNWLPRRGQRARKNAAYRPWKIRYLSEEKRCRKRRKRKAQKDPYPCSKFFQRKPSKPSRSPTIFTRREKTFPRIDWTFWNRIRTRKLLWVSPTPEDKGLQRQRYFRGIFGKKKR